RTPTPSSSTLFPYTTLFRSFGSRSAAMVAAAVRSASPRSALDEDAVVDQEAPQDVAGGHRLPSLEALLGHELRNRFVHGLAGLEDRKSTRLNSSHDQISYAV